VDASGNVGIGTASPATTLQVQKNLAGGTSFAAYIDNGAAGAGTNVAGIAFSNAGNPKASITAAVYGNDYLSFNVGGAGTTERMRLDASGNVGIGTTNPDSKLQIVQTINNGSSFARFTAGTLSIYNSQGLANTPTSLRFTHNFSSGDKVTGEIGSTKTDYFNSNSHYIFFNTNDAERMRLTSTGDLQITNRCNIGTSGIHYTGVGGVNTIAFKWSGPNVIARIDNVVDVTLANVSDYRIKRNIESMQTSALNRIADLRPVTYQLADYGTLFRASEDIKEGFIAHELQAVIPSAVEGEKDAEDQIQSLKLDALCSVMVKAIQELSAKVDAQAAEAAALRSEIAELKAK